MMGDITYTLGWWFVSYLHDLTMVMISVAKAPLLDTRNGQ